MEQENWSEIARQSGSPLSLSQIDLLVEFRNWLATEAVDAGGLGPHEIPRLERRHITDSLLFSLHIPVNTTEVSDLGSGVGLPGVPLAILRPKTQFRLIDRSQRRVDLMRRVVRMLNLSNVDIVQSDIDDLDDEIELIVSRATRSPQEVFPLVEKLLSPTGTAILGGSWTAEPQHSGWDTVDVGGEVLDQPVWLLIIRRR